MEPRAKSFLRDRFIRLVMAAAAYYIYMVRSEATNALLGALAPKAKGAQPPGGGGEGKNQN